MDNRGKVWNEQQKNEQKNEEKKKQYRLLIVLAGLILAFVIGSIILQQCLDGSLLEYYGSVLTMTGTLILGAVTVWQTKKSLEIAEKSQRAADKTNDFAKRSTEIAEENQKIAKRTDAREAEEAALKKQNEELQHQLQLEISPVRHGDMTEDDLKSAWVLRVPQKDWEERSNSYAQRNRDDLKYPDGERKGKLREDLLFLKVSNHSAHNVKITVDTKSIRQFFETDKGNVPFDDFVAKEIKSMGIRGKEERDAHRSGRRTDEGY